MRALAALVCLALSTEAAAQTPEQDSTGAMAVIGTFHRALQQGDTATVMRLMTPYAVFIDEGQIRDWYELKGKEIAGKARWVIATKRTIKRARLRVISPVAWYYSEADLESKDRPDLFQGITAESIVLTRLGTSWYIEEIHWSLKGS
jgi:hypothetical protein